MNLVIAPKETLPQLIDKATTALTNAKSSAEVLEARDLARVAYDAAKSALRIAKAKQAHDSLMVEVHTAQAHALSIRARAEMRLAEEWEAAQESGAANKNGGDRKSEIQGGLLISRKKIGFEGRLADEAIKLRDAEQANPGIVQRTINGFVERGEEPTKEAVYREITKPKKPTKVMDKSALWLWGTLKDFERDGHIDKSAQYLLSEMTSPMRADVRRLLPLVIRFLKTLENMK